MRKTKLRQLKNNQSVISLRVNKDYKSLLKNLKEQIKSARLKVSLIANREMIRFYWEIGKMILECQQQSQWGDKLVDALAIDLKSSFPDTQGFSRANLHNMRKFAEIYPTLAIVQAVPGQLPWTHNVILLEQVKLAEARQWYAKQAIENGWSYRVFMEQVKNKVYERQSKKAIKTTNFKHRLPHPQSVLAEEIVREPYRFDFLNMGKDAREKEVQRGLVTHIANFLLALGQGFALYGNYVPVKVSNKTYQIDLLMYHTKLHCYVVIELKKGEFKPKDAGQLNFYLSIVDDHIKMPQDNPSVGLLLGVLKVKNSTKGLVSNLCFTQQV